MKKMTLTKLEKLIADGYAEVDSWSASGHIAHVRRWARIDSRPTVGLYEITRTKAQWAEFYADEGETAAFREWSNRPNRLK